MMELPDALAEKVLQHPETHMGVHTVALALRNGRVIDDVEVAWGREIIRVEGHDDFDIPLDDVVDVLDRS